MSLIYQDLEKLLNIKFKDTSLLEQAFIHRSYLNEVKEKKLVSNERLEFLGDSILSFITSEYLYKKFPELPEGNLTSYRSALVCARTLSKVAEKLSLGKYLLMSKGEKESGGMTNPTLLANTIEALIGAIYLDKGIKEAKKFIYNFILPYLPEIIKNKAFKDYKSYFQEIVQEKIKVSPVYKVLDSWGPDHDKRFKIGVFINNELFGEGIGKSKQEGEQHAAKEGIEKWKKMR